MKKILLPFFVLLAGFTSTLPAEDVVKASGRFFVAPTAAVGDGESEFVLHFGGGGEGLVAGGFGLSADLGYLFHTDYFSRGIGLFSPGVVYQFNRTRRTVPFVTGGYTLAFREGAASAVFVGGGMNRWFGDHLGVRFEVQDHFRPEIHLIEGRVSLLIR